MGAEEYEKRGGVRIPRTNLGKMVQEGKISSLEEIFAEGMKILEPEIVDALLPGLRNKVLNINLVQKQTDAGEKSRFKSLVVLGNYDGYVGLGTGKAKDVRMAIDKGIIAAKLNIVPVRRGCGNWECGCGEPHSLPFKTIGKCGSVRVELIPAPKGVGIVAGDTAKTVISFAGIKDCWTRSFGSTRTTLSFAYAAYNALKATYHIVTVSDQVR